MTLVRRQFAIGALWMMLVAATAPAVAAAEGLPGLTSASDAASDACPAPALLALPCTVLPPAPVTDPPLLPAGPELVPAVLTDVDDLLSVTDPLPVTEVLQSVPEIVALPGVSEATDEGPTPSQAAEQPGATSPHQQPAPGTAAARVVDMRVEDDPGSRRESATVDVTVQTPAQPATDGVQRTGAAEVDVSSARLGGDTPVVAQPVVVALVVGGGVSLVVELARGGGGGLASIVAFNIWLRRQLRESRMSQRQLAEFSGVNHSTISRLMSGVHEPSLATATKLVDALRKLGGLPHAADYFARVAESPVLPAKRVEAALLGDDELDDQDVRELMHAYLVARARRRRARSAAAANGGAIPSEGPTPA